MSKKNLIIIGLVAFLPTGLFAATVGDSLDTIIIKEDKTKVTEEILILDWAEENAVISSKNQEEVSGEVVSFRLALEILDLDANVNELEELRNGDSWTISLRAAWLQHKISVQLRRIDLLLKSAIKQRVIKENIEEVLHDYILGVREKIRE